MQILGKQLPDLDLAELETAESLEKHLNKYAEITTRNADANISRTDQIKAICDVTYETFDNLFGAGTANQVFEGRNNMMLCYKAMTELIRGVQEIDARNASMITELSESLNK